MHKIHIGILDDDKFLANEMADLLTRNASLHSMPLQMHVFDSGIELLKTIQSFNFDMLILDRQLPDIGGDEILTWIRQKAPLETIIVMVTSIDEHSEVARIITMGADDYVTKPFSPDVLVARVMRLIKRSRQMHEQGAASHFSLSGFDFDRLKLTIRRGEETFSCSSGEFALAEYLFKNIGQPLSRKQIFEAVWQRRAVPSSRALDTQIHRVRSKLGLTIDNGFSLQPIYGVGYRLDVVGDAVDAI